MNDPHISLPIIDRCRINYQASMESKPLLTIPQLTTKIAKYIRQPPIMRSPVPLAALLTNSELMAYNYVEITTIASNFDSVEALEQACIEESRIFHAKRGFMAALYLADTYNKISHKDPNKPYQMLLEVTDSQELTTSYTLREGNDSEINRY